MYSSIVVHCTRKIIKMKKYILLILFTSCIALSCKTDTKKSTNSESQRNNTEVKSLKFANLPSLPQDAMQKLFIDATYIDYIFYNLPFSVSQDNQPSIRANLRLISQEAIEGIKEGCKPIGREFFHIGGIIAYEADVYFENGCFAYVFIQDKKPVFANKISEAGMKFYSNLINQAKQIQNTNGG